MIAPQIWINGRRLTDHQAIAVKRSVEEMRKDLDSEPWAPNTEPLRKAYLERMLEIEGFISSMRPMDAKNEFAAEAVFLFRQILSEMRHEKFCPAIGGGKCNCRVGILFDKINRFITDVEK